MPNRTAAGAALLSGLICLPLGGCLVAETGGESDAAPVAMRFWPGDDPDGHGYDHRYGYGSDAWRRDRSWHDRPCRGSVQEEHHWVVRAIGWRTTTLRCVANPHARPHPPATVAAPPPPAVAPAHHAAPPVDRAHRFAMPGRVPVPVSARSATTPAAIMPPPRPAEAHPRASHAAPAPASTRPTASPRAEPVRAPPPKEPPKKAEKPK